MMARLTKARLIHQQQSVHDGPKDDMGPSEAGEDVDSETDGPATKCAREPQKPILASDQDVALEV
jgi:hypothetical protein